MAESGPKRLATQIEIPSLRSLRLEADTRDVRSLGCRNAHLPTLPGAFGKDKH